MVDIVLQGPCYPYTQTIIEEYRKLPFVGKIILSSYEGSLCFSLPKYVEFVNNSVVHPTGVTNRNLQINTSKNGLVMVDSKVAVKMRTCQLIRSKSMEEMNDYYNFYKNNSGKHTIFVCGMYKTFPYHPRDHVFWGKTEDLKYLFDIPFDMNPDATDDYDWNVRSETYIGQYYYSRFDDRIKKHIACPRTFLCDKSPRREEAMKLDHYVRNEAFRPFPKISMAWPKHGLQEYHYDVGMSFGEYWGEW